MTRYHVEGQLAASYSRARIARVAQIDLLIDVDFVIRAGTPQQAVDFVAAVAGWDCESFAVGCHLVVTDEAGAVVLERRQPALEEREEGEE